MSEKEEKMLLRKYPFLEGDSLELYKNKCELLKLPLLNDYIIPLTFKSRNEVTGKYEIVRVSFHSTLSSLILLANRSTGEKRFAGFTEPIWERNDDGKAISVKSTINIFHPKTGDPIPYCTDIIFMDEFYPGGKKPGIWATKKHFMLSKCLKANLLRMLSPELAFLYTDDEIPSMKNEEPKSKGIPGEGRTSEGKCVVKGCDGLLFRDSFPHAETGKPELRCNTCKKYQRPKKEGSPEKETESPQGEVELEN